MTEQTAQSEPTVQAVPAVEPEVSAPPRDRRVLRAVARWTAAVLVFGAVGSGVAYGITERERTDLPGLETRSDGRLDYPRLAEPALPAGAPVPFAADNKDGIHYAELSMLLLPVPAGAKPEAAHGSPLDQYLQAYAPAKRAGLREELTDSGLRQAVVRGWTTPDGTRTRIHLLRFPSSDAADISACGFGMKLTGTDAFELDSDWLAAKGTETRPGQHTQLEVYREAQPAGPEYTRAACVQAGDLHALITMTRKGSVPLVPFHQAVVLQDQLLG